MSRRRGRVARAFAAAAVCAMLLPEAARAGWVASWAAAPATLGTASLRTTTVRQFMRLSLGGTRLRVRFSNETGTDPLTVSDAHLALPGSDPASVDGSSDRPLTFAGRASTVIPPGAVVLSDAVALTVASLARVAVTAVFDSTSRLQVGHLIGGDTSYLVAGDHALDLSLTGAGTTTARVVVTGIDVGPADESGAAIGALGDSITDGYAATPDRDRRWTDRLAARLAARTAGPAYAVLDLGLSSNAVLDGQLLSIGGASALARFDRDVLARPGLRWLILFEGINDIGLAADGSVVAGLTAGYRQIVLRAHDRGIKVIGATLTPFAGSDGYSAQRERWRVAVNTWIRTMGVFDGVVDFDAVLGAPSKPDTLRPAYDSGDHLHPNDAGYRAMGESVPLDLFR